jgi:uncharacterized cupredoxin-like copper-binding protein
MRKLAVISALGLMATALYAQGLNPPSTQTKEDWEEINFEFNSSILSDGYPSLLRLADLLSQHKDFKVAVTGNTDYVGSGRYNDKLALARANTVKDFLVKYGASPDQVSVAGNGKRDPEVDNKSKEGRFMNRRVVLRVTNGQGQLVKEGGISDVLDGLQAFMKKQQECCDQILKRLDKLDDILAALKNLQGENDQLKGELADQRNQLNALKDQVNGMPKPLTSEQTTNIAHNEAMGALDEAQKRNKKFAILGANIGPTFGPTRQGDFTFSGSARFFSPFGGDGSHAVQAQGEYIYNPDSQEAQFDLGLVNRWNNIQAGVFGSFKYLNYKQYQNGGSLGQAAFMLDWLFSRGRFGLFGTQGFKNYAVLNRVLLAPGAYLETYAKVVNQYGVDALIGVWGNAYMQGNVGYLRRDIPGYHSTVGAEYKLVQPLSSHVAFTAEADLNQTYVGTHLNGQVLFGLEVGNYIRPKDYASVKTPVPMDVPRIRYDFGTRRVGSSPPIANAGPQQTGVAAGTVTLNGSASYDPLGETLTYHWTQLSGPSVTISNADQAVATFTAVAGQTYTFALKVTNTDGLSATATTSVSSATAAQVQISQFTANPTTVQSGQSSTLTWVVQNATSVTIQPNVGSVNANSGSTSVSPTATTTYTLTATGASGTVNQSVTIVVGSSTPAQIVRFEASPLTIAPGGQTTLSWATNGATSVSISGVGTVTPNGSTTVSPTQTTTYTLSAVGGNGQTITSPVTVTVTGSGIPQIATFVATPSAISPGQSTKICWQVTGATSIAISPGVGTSLNANDCATVSPTASTTYTLTATNAQGTNQGNVTVTVGQVQILSFTANPPYSTSSGAPIVLSWQTANATSVVVTGAEIQASNLPVNGSTTINPTTNGTYTLTAYGPGGQTVSVSISVFVR